MKRVFHSNNRQIKEYHQEYPPETIQFPLSNNQTKWPIELWSTEQEMETNEDDATMREILL